MGMIKLTTRFAHSRPFMSVGVAVMSMVAASVAVEAAEFVAGTTPDRRPEGAPRIQSLKRDAGWMDSALSGVSKPTPRSLRFLEDQGAWFTPFTRPNMPGHYDIRGLYAARGAKSAQ
jgi:hypothetical protein